VGSELWEARSKPSLHVSPPQSGFLVRMVMEGDRLQPTSPHRARKSSIFRRGLSITLSSVDALHQYVHFPSLLPHIPSLPPPPFVPTILALCWQTFSTTSHLCTLHLSYLHLPRTVFCGHDPFSSLLFYIFLCCYLTVTCCCPLVGHITTVVKFRS
jgi:hypothetical protein